MVTPLEEAEQRVKVLRAQERLKELENTFQTVKQEVAGAETLSDLVKIMGRYVAKVNNARSVIKHSED